MNQYMTDLRFIMTDNMEAMWSQGEIMNNVIEKIRAEGWQNIDPNIIQRAANIIQEGVRVTCARSGRSYMHSVAIQHMVQMIPPPQPFVASNTVNVPGTAKKLNTPGPTLNTGPYKPRPEATITVSPLAPVLKPVSTPKPSCPAGSIPMQDYPHNPNEFKCFKVIGRMG